MILNCTHQKTTFPQTRDQATGKRTYVACTKCGTEMDYDWKRMRLVKPTFLERIRKAVGR